MADWYLSRRNYETLEKIFKEEPPYLFWDDEFVPLYRELEGQLGGNKIMKNDEPKTIKLDSGCGVEICQIELIESAVVHSKIKIVLETAGVKPMTPQTGWGAQLRAVFSLRRRGAILRINRPCPPESDNRI